MFKWIRAIKKYDDLKFHLSCLKDDKDKLTESCRTLTQLLLKAEKDRDYFKEQVRQCQIVFKAHRTVAELSILDAEKAKLEYDNKAKQLNAENPRNPPL